MLQIPSVSLFKGSGDQLFRRFTTGLKIWWFLKLFGVETAESFGVRHQRSHKLPGGGAVQWVQCYYCSWSHLDRLNPSIHAFYPAWNFLSANIAINFNLTSIEMIFSRIPLTPCRFAFPSLRLPQSGVVTQGAIRLGTRQQFPSLVWQSGTTWHSYLYSDIWTVSLTTFLSSCLSA